MQNIIKMLAYLQGTLPSTLKEPSFVSMWNGAKTAYLVLGLCYFPLAVGGYAGFGNKVQFP